MPIYVAYTCHKVSGYQARHVWMLLICSALKLGGSWINSLPPPADPLKNLCLVYTVYFIISE